MRIRRSDAGLSSARIGAFLATKDPKRALAFYRDTLGLRLIGEDPFALVFDAGGVTLRIQIVARVSVAKYTALGWQVPNIAAAVRRLERAGVVMQRFPGLVQDRLGIWTAPGGARVAWFKDPEGHILSVAQMEAK